MRKAYEQWRATVARETAETLYHECLALMRQGLDAEAHFELATGLAQYYIGYLLEEMR